MMTNTEKHPTRRGFLDWLIGIGTSVTGLAMAVPALMYLWPAARTGGSDNVEVEGASDMAPGQSKTVQVGGKAVIVVRSHGGFEAYSAICTHLGCLVQWDGTKRQFLCPCHAAAFDAQGRVVSGPPPAPLPPYRVKEVAGKVYVSPT
ncbi:MAG: ubiquinol-cytochrome c reductase iron-sulfur subunit [Phycisphaerales bacterium]|nr:MAG: ubiquinol-cytochrome c reductase iron-sulfur subunit [Phycisphaerales bacterium]